MTAIFILVFSLIAYGLTRVFFKFVNISDLPVFPGRLIRYVVNWGFLILAIYLAVEFGS